MGTWGPGLYADDTALNLRNDWSTRMRWGGKAEELTDDLAKQYGDDDTTFWLVLADLQWKCGHLIPRVREKALAIITSGADLARWNDASAKDRNARLATLDRLRVQLESPPPPAKAYPAPKGSATPMTIGEVYTWRLLDGRFAFLHVCGMCRNLGIGPAPSFRVLDLVTENIPPLQELAPLPSRKAIRRFELTEKAEPTFLRHPQAAVGTFGPRQYPKARLQRLGALPIPVGIDDKTMVIRSSWLGADELFATMYGVGWWVGDIVAWTRVDVPPVILSITDVSTLREGDVTVPYVSLEVLGWSGGTLPPVEALLSLKPIVVPGGPFHGPRLVVKGLPPAGRFKYIGRVPCERSEAPAHVYNWTEVEAIFTERLARV